MRDWIVPISPHERAAGQMHPITAQAAREILAMHGAVLLRGVFAPEAIDKLHEAYLDQQGSLDAEAAAEQAERPGASPALKVGEGRYDRVIKLKGGFGDPALFGNPLLCRFLLRVLDETMKLSGMTMVTAYPGADMQHVHRDHGPLFAEPGVSGALPSYAINVAVPLIDVDAALGPTALALGSHLWPIERGATPSDLWVSEFLRGDCVLIDYRTLHAGLPNTSHAPRPILYMVYARTWFFDEINHTTRPSLDLDPDDFEAMPEHLKPLLSRAHSQHLRMRYLAGTRSDPA